MEEMMRLKMLADANLAALAKNPYPGRGIVVGLDETGENLVQVYWIMGRSENSRNRVFGSKGGCLFTEAADPSKVKDPSLIIYNAMRETRSCAVVSNGAQTDAIAKNGMLSLRGYTYEPDAPNFTPRITACSFRDSEVGGKNVWRTVMSVLRKSPWSEACDRHQYEFNDFGRGFGHCIHTYSGDGNPLPAFQGEPYLVPLVGGAEAIAQTYLAALNEENRVSLAVKFVWRSAPSYIGIINKYEKVAA